ncbi:MAG: metallophosphoesterase [Butyribacter sp.]|nr:metallophosphoesterase [bacterium]MDY3854249.1 metallophosphoesterase [Butyribacter sp.]
MKTSKKILVVSDTHGNDTNLKKVISLFGEKGRELEMLIHLGDSYGSREQIQSLVDCPVEAVRGNGDFSPDLPISNIIPIGREKAFITHGHRYHCKMSTELMVDMARDNNASMVLFGHTHVPMAEMVSGVLVLNPGSISLPRQDGHRPTYMVLSIREDNSVDYSIVTM